MSRRHVPYLAIRFFWVLCVASYAAVMLCGCGGGGARTPATPTDPKEVYVLGKTDQYATTLKVNVKGVITDARHTYGCESPTCVDYGWYEAGKAFYWRPGLAEMEVGSINLDLLAAHETCHAVSFFHDTTHWCCVWKLTRAASYPPPVTVMGQWPTCG